jgi:hypothetical protein
VVPGTKSPSPVQPSTRVVRSAPATVPRETRGSGRGTGAFRGTLRVGARGVGERTVSPRSPYQRYWKHSTLIPAREGTVLDVPRHHSRFAVDVSRESRTLAVALGRRRRFPCGKPRVSGPRSAMCES